MPAFSYLFYVLVALLDLLLYRCDVSKAVPAWVDAERDREIARPYVECEESDYRGKRGLRRNGARRGGGRLQECTKRTP